MRDDQVMRTYGWDNSTINGRFFREWWRTREDDSRADAWGGAQCVRVWGTWRGSAYSCNLDKLLEPPPGDPAA